MKALELMRDLTSEEVREKLRPLTSRRRGTGWKWASFAVERVRKVVNGEKGNVVYREGVLGVSSLAGRLGVLSVLWDELRIQQEVLDGVDRDFEVRPVGMLVRNVRGKLEGTTRGKVTEDLRGFLGVEVVMGELTEAMRWLMGLLGIDRFSVGIWTLMRRGGMMNLMRMRGMGGMMVVMLRGEKTMVKVKILGITTRR